MTLKTIPTFILVMAVAVRGHFRRCGIRFDQTWRPVKIGDETNLAAAIPVITPAQYEEIRFVSEPQRLKTRAPNGSEKPGETPKGELVPNTREAFGPPMLSIRPASEQEIEDFLLNAAAGPVDKDATIAGLQSKVADYEGRLMRLEMDGQGKRDASADNEAAIAELQRRNEQLLTQNALLQQQNADRDDRLARLEQLLHPATPTPSASDTTPMVVEKPAPAEKSASSKK